LNPSFIAESFGDEPKIKAYFSQGRLGLKNDLKVSPLDLDWKISITYTFIDSFSLTHLQTLSILCLFPTAK
jgi:hypothetical protein